jgi:hypothetical protein
MLWVTASKEANFYERKVYGIIDVLGEVGGIIQVFTIIGSFFTSSFSEHFLQIKML